MVFHVRTIWGWLGYDPEPGEVCGDSTNAEFKGTVLDCSNDFVHFSYIKDREQQFELELLGEEHEYVWIDGWPSASQSYVLVCPD